MSEGAVPPPPPLCTLNKACLCIGASKPSLSRWHDRLGHPSLSIVHRVISSNKHPCSIGSINESVCDACQQAKAHQLPYPRSVSQSSSPVCNSFFFFGVSAPAGESVGGKQYCDSFINNYRKFIWIYLIKFRHKAF